MRTCGLADLRTGERVNCGPKVARGMEGWKAVEGGREGDP